MQPALEREYVDYVRANVTWLRRSAYRLCGDSHRADDLVQQAITKLYVNWRRARAADNTDAYLQRILVRVFLDERRLRWSGVSLFAMAPDVVVQPDGRADDRAVLRAALDRLPRRLCTVLVLRFLFDMSVEDVAEVLGCSQGTIKSQTSRGLAAMRRLLDDTSVPTATKEA
ncbi:SigE family RNA polymerase sigma factor [Actinophytocola xanthii]|uniref:RNA polymerase subunit sigma-24 n=1 Tax=Actinophytocola xanthii TaxID=1912961 RepID=A0A1Q8BYV0_9PSEU|nr:SigE family RNA polymerase sigma factor [Actinophytocola xanthii]OLF07296.1 RNA polymerase subunit sigma-24 [Actinophytocola xanthii]OLF07458.1 RNA polymerase subunit sigma-24 [Actinophytocola xanthii]